MAKSCCTLFLLCELAVPCFCCVSVANSCCNLFLLFLLYWMHWLVRRLLKPYKHVRFVYLCLCRDLTPYSMKSLSKNTHGPSRTCAVMGDRDRYVPKTDDAENPGTVLHVSNLHPHTREKDITAAFSKYGGVDHCSLVLDPHTGTLASLALTQHRGVSLLCLCDDVHT